MGDDSNDSNVTYLRPRSTAPPGLPPLPAPPPGRPTPPLPAPTAPAPGPLSGAGAVFVPGSNRRSAADSLAAATTPGLPAPPAVPATFRSDGLDDAAADEEAEEIGMGTLGLAAILAIALAALRGTASALTDWRQRRMEAATEAAPLRTARLRLREARMRADAASAGHGRVPSSNEYGRRSLGRGGPTGGGSGSTSARHAAGAGRAPSPAGGRTGNSSAAGSGRAGSPSGGAGAGPGRKGSTGGSGDAGKASGPKGATSAGPDSSHGGRKRPGTLGQLWLDRSKRRTARDAADAKHAARQHKADLAERKRAAKHDSPDHASSGTGKSTPAAGDDGRITLGKAIGDEARRRAEERLRRRREDLHPPVISRFRKADDEAGDEAGDADGDSKAGDSTTAEGAAAASTPDTDTSDPKAGPDSGPEAPSGGWGPGYDPSGAETPSGGPTAAGTAWGPGYDPSGPETDYEPDWEFWETPRGARHNPWDSLFDATWEAEVVWTVERVDRPGDAAPRWEPAAIGRAPAGLPPAAPAPAAAAGAAAGTTSTVTMTKETRVSAPLIPRPGPAGVASEHLTEVTLDDVLDALATSKTNCFTTYDECAVLAQKATELRMALNELAEELRARHNIIGRLTGAAMERLAEAMDLLARKANHMRGESLKAAEAVEVAHDEMYDAYKPVQQAAADAGLVMPSARIHNED